ncbi:MAG: bifunctional DNA primase/polymerase [Myxococcales bacterium]|nr:bifunctional DNA primase/polymerase [Myxococcales bacterium]
MAAPQLLHGPLHAAAIAYARRGWKVHPLQPQSKKPASSHGFKDATTSLAKIGRWWRSNAGFNVGVATGEGSGVFVLDVDPGGECALSGLEAASDTLPRTVEASTGRKDGRHLYFAYPGVRVACSSGALGRGLDVRGDGGYVVVPPSVHPNGRRYSWAAGRGPGEIDLAHAPSRLLTLVAPAQSASAYGSGALRNARDLILSSLRGSRNTTTFRQAVAIFELVEGGEIDEAEATAVLHKAALGTGLPKQEVDGVLRGARDRVRGKPRRRPSRTRRTERNKQLSDLGNAERLVEKHGDDLRYCALLGGWYVWDGKRWVGDETGEVYRRAKRTVRSIYSEASTATEEETRKAIAKHALASERASRIDAMVRLAQSEETVATPHDAFDREPL